MSQRCLYQQPAARHGGYDILCRGQAYYRSGKAYATFLASFPSDGTDGIFRSFSCWVWCICECGQDDFFVPFVPDFISFMGGRVPLSLLPFFSVVFLPLSHVQISFPCRHFLSDISFLFIPIPNFSTSTSLCIPHSLITSLLSFSPTDRPLRPIFGNPLHPLRRERGRDPRIQSV